MDLLREEDEKERDRERELIGRRERERGLLNKL